MDIDVLFDKRQELAFKLKKVMKEKSYTKMRLCKEADISRPTLDKIMNCEVTNMKSFKKYVSKIANCLDISIDDLVQGVEEVCKLKYRYMRHLTTQNIEEIENFVNSMNTIEVINVSSYAEKGTAYHTLWYWLYTKR